MSHYPNYSKERLTVSCYKCTAGCIRVEYSNVMFTFMQEQFLTFAEIIGETPCIVAGTTSGGSFRKPSKQG